MQYALEVLLPITIYPTFQNMATMVIRTYSWVVA
jgi:hypothetical protein